MPHQLLHLLECGLEDVGEGRLASLALLAGGSQLGQALLLQRLYGQTEELGLAVAFCPLALYQLVELLDLTGQLVHQLLLGLLAGLLFLLQGRFSRFSFILQFLDLLPQTGDGVGV